MRIFGVPFDPPNSPERLNLKLAYVSHCSRRPNISETFYDPYDVIRADLRGKSQILDDKVWLGKVAVDSWLAPRPQLTDLHRLAIAECVSFLEGNGCWGYALKVADFVSERIFPRKPVMIGVDHSLTGGVLVALAEQYDNLNVIVLDAHFDVIKLNTLVSHHILSGKSCINEHRQRLPFYHCGNFLAYMLESKIIRPENLWILGVQEAALARNSLPGEVKKWIDRGVHVVSKKDIISEGISLDLNGPTYVSIDMDVGSLSSVFSARFMNCYGLSFEEFLGLLSRVAMSIKEANVPLLGLDIMEIDIHFLEANEMTPFHDSTKSIVTEIFNCFYSGK